jgi:AraC-like DNA-binding protein
MVYMKRGEAVFEIEDRQVGLGPNNIVIIKPKKRHRLLVGPGKGCEFIVLSFRLAGYEASDFSKASIEDFIDFVEGDGAETYISLKVSQRNEIIRLLNDMVREINGREPDAEFLLRLMVMETFVHLSRSLRLEWENSMKDKSPKLKELVKIAVNYINMNYEKELKLADIANFIYLSPSYLTRVFREEMKVSPINYLLKVRVLKAKEMLADPDVNIGDVAVAVGFSNHQRFNEIFKKNAGMTPSDFRRQISVKNDNIRY